MAGKIPQAAIDEVLHRTSLVELIDSYVPLTKRGKNFTACCPFHQEKSPSFNVIPDKQFYYCFGCGASGNAISFLMQHQKKDFVSAVEWLASKAGLLLPASADVRAMTPQQQDAYALMEQVAQDYQKALQQASTAQRYLHQRGLSQEVIERFRLGYAAPGWERLLSAYSKQARLLEETGMVVKREDGRRYDRYRDRLMFPIFDKRLRVIAFGGRVIDGDQKPKYLNSPETPYFHKSNVLYGYSQLPAGTLPQILVVEGYMDVISLHQHGIENVVATLGTATTINHLQQLFRRSTQLVFCFDGDAAGRSAAIKALTLGLPRLEDGQWLKFLFLPQGHDPDSWVREQGKTLMEHHVAQAMTMDELLFQQLTTELDLETLAGRLQCVNRARSWFADINAPTLKAFLLQRLAVLSQLSETRVQALLRAPDEVAVAPPSPPKQARRRPQRSPLRHALTLLVQYPQVLATSNLPQGLIALDQPGVVWLRQLHQQITAETTTAMLLEHWRDHDDYPHLLKLAAVPLDVPSEGVVDEFNGAVAQILRHELQQQVNHWLQRARVNPLSPEQKSQLQRMIQQLKSESDREPTSNG